MTGCSAFGCTNREGKCLPNISFHKFPLVEPRRSEWIKAVRRENWIPSKHAVLCSAHFEEKMIDRSMKRINLAKTAIPTIFSAFPKHLQKVQKTRNTVNSSENALEDATSAYNEEMPTCSAETSYKRKWEEAEEKLNNSRKKIKTLQQANRRYKKRIQDLKQLIKLLKEKRFVNEDEAQVLDATAGHTKEIFDRINAKARKKSHRKQFNPKLRAFALTLHYFSTSAYRFVRKSFDLCLPHPRTIAKWYQHVKGRPGFTKESFTAVSHKIKEAKHELLFCLTFDEMAIRQHIEFDGKFFHGYINMGTNMENNSEVLPTAKASLVFILTAVNDHWKIPLGYFLIDSISSAQKANLVRQCLRLLHKIKANAICLTFDGLSTNITMSKLLGCNMEPESLKPHFPHPTTKCPIYIYLDPSHMLKLIRNCLGEKKSLFDSDNSMIQWEFIKELHMLQDVEGLHVSNKLRSAHINFFTRKMNVSLAAQVLSKSVADALQILKDKNFPQFTGCEATIKFIRVFNDLFDILNSHSTDLHGWKKAVNKETYIDVRSKLYDIKTYILGLKESRNGNPMTKSARKVGFLGFLCCIESTLNLIEKYIQTEESPIVYLPTYKLSQDHIELFFSKVRMLGRWNNNPTARQFESAYKKLLVQSQLSDSKNGNCIPLEKINILNVSSYQSEDVINMTTNLKSADIINEDENIIDIPLPDHDYIFTPAALSICAEQVVHYISGYISRKLSAKIKCPDCSSALFGPKITKSLISYKSSGHLVYPSEDVFKISKKCESLFRKFVNLSGGKDLKECYSLQYASSAALKLLIGEDLFPALNEHMLRNEVMDNHHLHLVKSIIHQYLLVRYHYFSKRLGRNNKNEKNVRQLYTKIIQFKGQ